MFAPVLRFKNVATRRVHVPFAVPAAASVGAVVPLLGCAGVGVGIDVGTVAQSNAPVC